MADWYWSPTESNKGTASGNAFGNRQSSFTTLTGAATGSNNVFRCPKSPDPVDTGQTATWTNGSLTVTLASAVTVSMYNDGAWTASSSVTCTADAANKKEGTDCSSIAIAAGFTTGKAAYYATGTLNLGGYGGVSAWTRSSNVAGNGGSNAYQQINICTDTTGDIPLNSMTGYCGVVNTWSAVFSDLSNPSLQSPLTNGIQSISLFYGGDPGALTVLVDNVIACLPASSALGLHHNMLIGPSSGGPWYPIKSINGTTVTLDNHTNSLQGQGRGYWGPSGTYQLWKREPLYIYNNSFGVERTQPTYVSFTPAFNRPTAATTAGVTYGAATNGYTISGGWDVNSMSTQDGETYLAWGCGAGNLFDLGSTTTFTVEKFHISRANSFATFVAANDGITINGSVIGCTASPAIGPISGQDTTSFINCYAGNNQTIGFGTAANATNQGLIVRGLKSYNNGGLGFSSPIGTAFALGYVEISDVEVANNGGAQGFLLQNPCKLINNIRAYDNAATSANAGIQLTGQNVYAFNLAASGHATAGSGGILVNGANPRLYNVTTSTNANGILAGSAGLFIDSKINLYNWTSTSDTNAIGYPSSNVNQGWVNSSKEAGVAATNKSTSTYGVVSTDTSVTHSGTYSWKLAPGSTTQATQFAPLDHTIGKIPCNANKTITIKYWGRYSHATNIPSQLRIIGGLIPGVGSVGSDIITAFSGSADTWAQYTLTCTPTVDCVLEVIFESYISSGSGHVSYVDGSVEVT